MRKKCFCGRFIWTFLGETSCILIDTLESFEAAEDVKKAFEAKVPNKPIVAIILVIIKLILTQQKNTYDICQLIGKTLELQLTNYSYYFKSLWKFHYKFRCVCHVQGHAFWTQFAWWVSMPLPLTPSNPHPLLHICSILPLKMTCNKKISLA